MTNWNTCVCDKHIITQSVFGYSPQYQPETHYQPNKQSSPTDNGVSTSTQDPIIRPRGKALGLIMGSRVNNYIITQILGYPPKYQPETPLSARELNAWADNGSWGDTLGDNQNSV